MSGLFGGGGSAQAASTPPSTSSVSRDTVTSLLKKRKGMRGRASAMLVSGNEAPQTAKRAVTGQG